MGSTQLRRDQFADDSVDNEKLSNADDYRINQLDVDTSGVFGGLVYASGFVGDGSQLTDVSTSDTHGDLSGLTDDDHPQYARTDGSRVVTGDQLFAQGVALSDDILVSGHLQNPVGATSGYVMTTDSSGQGSWQPADLKNIVTVSPANGDFTSIQSAIDSISDASSSNRYVIQIGPGTYTENLTMKDNVDLRGVGDKSDVVLTASSGTVIQVDFTASDTFALSNLTINSASANNPVIGDAAAGVAAGGVVDVRIEDCIINVTHTSAQAIELGFGAVTSLVIARNDINVTGANSTGIYIDRITQNCHIVQNRIDSDGDYGLFISANRLDGAAAGHTAVVNTYQNVFVGSATHVALEADSGAGPVTWNSYGDILLTFEEVGTATNKTKNILGHTVNDKDIAALVANQQITTSGIELIADFQANGTPVIQIDTTGLLIPTAATSGHLLKAGDSSGHGVWADPSTIPVGDAATVDGFSAASTYTASQLIALDSNAEFPTGMHVAGSGTFDGDVFATGFSSTSPLPFKIAGTEVARFETNGDFGIGISSPSGILHVDTDGVSNDLVMDSDGNIGFGTADPNFFGSDAKNRVFTVQGNSSDGIGTVVFKAAHASATGIHGAIDWFDSAGNLEGDLLLEENGKVRFRDEAGNATLTIGSTGGVTADSYAFTTDPTSSNYIEIGNTKIAWGDLSAKNGDTVVVTFPGSGFTSTPVFVGTASRSEGGAALLVTWDSLSSTTATVRVVDLTDGTAGGTSGSTLTWMAIGTKP